MRRWFSVCTSRLPPTSFGFCRTVLSYSSIATICTVRSIWNSTAVCYTQPSDTPSCVWERLESMHCALGSDRSCRADCQAGSQSDWEAGRQMRLGSVPEEVIEIGDQMPFSAQTSWHWGGTRMGSIPFLEVRTLGGQRTRADHTGLCAPFLTGWRLRAPSPDSDSCGGHSAVQMKESKNLVYPLQTSSTLALRHRLQTNCDRENWSGNCRALQSSPETGLKIVYFIICCMKTLVSNNGKVAGSSESI